jgi:hypothetical protein
VRKNNAPAPFYFGSSTIVKLDPENDDMKKIKNYSKAADVQHPGEISSPDFIFYDRVIFRKGCEKIGNRRQDTHYPKIRLDNDNVTVQLK